MKLPCSYVPFENKIVIFAAIGYRHPMIWYNQRKRFDVECIFFNSNEKKKKKNSTELFLFIDKSVKEELSL